jgi:hypothetical protein
MLRSTIPEQVRLPLRTAAGIVARGIALRLGRSLVTLAGVALGIAFLMATLTAEVLRRGVAAEDAEREAANRAYGLLVSETGPLGNRRVGVIVRGTASDADRRLLARVAEDKPKGFFSPAEAPGTSAHLGIPLVSSGDFSKDASVLVLLGAGPLPQLDWQRVLGAMRQPVVAHTGRLDPPPGATVAHLAAPPSAEDIAAAATQARRSDARLRWIIAISLLVTVIGIANSMLMSVSERFRDIGTMKCLGALSSLVRTLFLLEAAFMGTVGGLLGVLGGALFTLLAYVVPYGGGLALGAFGAGIGAIAWKALVSLGAGVGLTLLAALYPAALAARMVPADALRSNV